jgi:hypothetical protein
VAETYGGEEREADFADLQGDGGAHEVEVYDGEEEQDGDCADLQESLAGAIRTIAEKVEGLCLDGGGSLAPATCTADDFETLRTSTAFLTQADIPTFRQMHADHQASQVQKLSALKQKPGRGLLFLRCLPGEKPRYIDGDEGWSEIQEGSGGRPVVFALQVLLYLPVHVVAFVAAKGSDVCHTCLQLYGQLASLVQRVSSAVGCPVFLPMMDAVPCVASAVPDSGQEDLWAGCRTASFTFLQDLMSRLPSLQLVVLSTKVYRSLRDEELDLFARRVKDSLVGAIENALGEAEGAVTSATAWTLGGGAPGPRLLLEGPHPSAKLTTVEWAVVGLALGHVLVSGSSLLQRVCADLLDVERLAACVQQAKDITEAIRDEDADAYAVLTGAYRRSPANVISPIEQQLPESVPVGWRAVFLQAFAVVLGNMTSVRQRVAASVAAQLQQEGAEMSLREIIAAVEEGKDDRGLGRIMLLHPDSQRFHLRKAITDLVKTVKGLASFKKHAHMTATPARLEYYVLGLLIDIHNGSLGGGWQPCPDSICRVTERWTARV